MSLDFEIDCPHCDKEISITSDQIGTTINCPHCNGVIELMDDGFFDGLTSVENSIDHLFNGLN